MSETIRSTPAAAGSGGELCTSCGLCCMGALHDYVDLQADEVTFAANAGLPVRPVDPPSFSLPCPKLNDRKCGIFPDRPRVCGAYRCQLLINKEAGLIELDSALQIVAQTHALLRTAEEVIAHGTLPQARQRAASNDVDALGSELRAAREQRMKERLRVMALDMFLDRHFRTPQEGRMYVAAD